MRVSVVRLGEDRASSLANPGPPGFRPGRLRSPPSAAGHRPSSWWWNPRRLSCSPRRPGIGCRTAGGM